ncbi:serine hydrolase domain-containing protein [Bordetella genomosp. 13]|uniref:serine hydrolase domain-containing protein n=1 Tax=Bordetella genomosp. 13 TaxID=463040 RepID=UPI001E30D7BB|nr:serine hydrolase domain-containing protein [Bordetella genomosp. 13]
MAAALPACGSDDDESDFSGTVEWGRQAIAQAMRAHPDTAAVSIALFHDEDIVWQEAFGQSAPQAGRAATIDTRFNVGSVSKVLAGLTGVILQDQGRLDLDRPVAEYLSDFTMLSPAYTRITSRHLLSHASGLPGTHDANVFSFGPVPGYAEAAAAGFAHYHLKHAPGQLQVYCNDGFTLFERVVLEVSGLSYPAFVQRYILDPLDMNRSGYVLAPSAEGTYAHPYRDGRQYPQEVCNAYATGGLCATPGDMMNLARMFLDRGMYRGRRIVSEAGIAAMAADQSATTRINPSPEWRWGLGWDSVRQPGLDAAGVLAWEKNGGTAFFSTEFFVIPEARLGLLLTGSQGYDPLPIAEGVLLRALEDAGRLRSLPSTVDRTPESSASAPADVADAAGIYGNYQAPIRVQVRDGGSTLALSTWRDGAWTPTNAGIDEYRYRADGWWQSGTAGAPAYRFVVAEGMDEEGLSYRYRYLVMRVAPGAGVAFVTMPIGQQLAARAPLSSAWRARLGSRWQVTNEAPESVALELDDGVLLEIGELDDLPGYVLVGGAQLLIPMDDRRAGMSVKVPVNHGRDLKEIVFEGGGTPVMRIGGMIYARADVDA